MQQVNKATYQRSSYHIPVLLRETIEGLAIQPGGIYVDCTFGGGGHSNAILEKLGGGGKLVVFDQDEDAKRNLPADERVVFVPHNFRHLAAISSPASNCSSRRNSWPTWELAVTSLMKPGRGFSTRFDADLDMRMDQRQSLTAFDVVKTYSEEQLHKMFEQYGEVTNSKTLAKTIVTVRDHVIAKNY